MTNTKLFPIRLKQQDGRVSLQLPAPDAPSQYEMPFASVRLALAYMIKNQIVLTHHHFNARSYIQMEVSKDLGKLDPIWDMGEKILVTSDEDVQRLRDSREKWVAGE